MKTKPEVDEIKLHREWMRLDKRVARREQSDARRDAHRDLRERMAERHVATLQTEVGLAYYCSLPGAWPHKKFASHREAVAYVLRRGLV